MNSPALPPQGSSAGTSGLDAANSTEVGAPAGFRRTGVQVQDPARKYRFGSARQQLADSREDGGQVVANSRIRKRGAMRGCVLDADRPGFGLPWPESAEPVSACPPGGMDGLSRIRSKSPSLKRSIANSTESAGTTMYPADFQSGLCVAQSHASIPTARTTVRGIRTFRSGTICLEVFWGPTALRAETIPKF